MTGRPLVRDGDPCPLIRELADGSLELEWPDDRRPEWIAVSRELFEAMVTEMSAGRVLQRIEAQRPGRRLRRWWWRHRPSVRR